MTVLYSTNCTKCNVIETKLKQLQIPFTVVTDYDIIIEKSKSTGIDSAPILQVDDKFYDFSGAIKYIKGLE